MDQIKELLREWAAYNMDGLGQGYPKQVSFANERVQSSNRSTDTYREQPEIIQRLNDHIQGNKEKGIPGLAPGFKRIIALEYLDRRPQKTKAALLGIPRQVFSQRLLWIHEQLNFTMFGR